MLSSADGVAPKPKIKLKTIFSPYFILNTKELYPMPSAKKHSRTSSKKNKNKNKTKTPIVPKMKPTPPPSKPWRPEKCYEPTDLHSWIELEDGTIIDPTPPPSYMTVMRMMRNLDGKQINNPVYSPYEGSKLEYAVEKLDEVLEGKLKKEIEDRGHICGNADPDFLKKYGYMPGNCFWNARAWSHFNKDVPHTIRYGKQGWVQKTGRVWWELGV